MSGIGGGGGFMLIYEAATQTVHALDYLGCAPAAADPECVFESGRDRHRRSLGHRAERSGGLAGGPRALRAARSRQALSTGHRARRARVAGEPVGGRDLCRVRVPPRAACRFRWRIPRRWRAAQGRRHRLTTGSGAKLPPDRGRWRGRLLPRRSRPAPGASDRRSGRVDHARPIWRRTRQSGENRWPRTTGAGRCTPRRRRRPAFSIWSA